MLAKSQSPLEPMVRKLGYHGELDAADEEEIRNLPHRTKTLERHGYVVREREKTTQSCVMLSGFAVRHKIVAGGARQIMAVHMKGDIVDLQNSFLGVADHSVQMLTDAEVAFIPREAITKLAFERPKVGWRCGSTRSLMLQSSANGLPTSAAGMRMLASPICFASLR